MSIELAIKANTLAYEARLIRKNEILMKHKAAILKHKGNYLSAEKREALIVKAERTRAKIHRHRVGVVRHEARATNLARAFLKGHPYRAVEQKTKTKPPIDKVCRMVKKYGGQSAEEVSDWFTAA